MNPLAYLRVAELLAGLALVAGICWGAHQFLEHERDIGRNEVRAEYAQKLADAKDAARAREKELTDQRDSAINERNQREQTIRSLSAAAGASANSLRDTLAGISNGVPSASVDALRKSTTTLASVLGECQDRYRELAEKADRHASDAKTLSEAWPTSDRK